MPETKVTTEELAAAPRLRVSRQDDLLLSTTWQRIDFNGNTSLDVNTFRDLANGQKQVAWDSTNKIFRFNQLEPDRNFDIRFGLQFNGGLRPVDVYLRFVVPSPTPLYFPFPLKADDPSLQGRGYVNIATLERIADFGTVYRDNLYSNQLSRIYGVGIELRSGISLLTQPTLMDCDFIIFGTM